MTEVSDATARSAMSGIQALVSREAGYSVAAKCLSVQADSESRDSSLRTPQGVRLHPDAWSWYQGALGEIRVGQLLASLGPEWRVLHSVPIGNGDTDVDHVVIGPNGVFVLNTKNHEGKSVWVGDHVLRVNNTNQHHLKHAASENRNVCQRLAAKVGFPVDVRSAIVLVGERSLKDGRAKDARPVAVISSRQLVTWLKAQPPSASVARVGLIRLAAEEPDTWHIDPSRADTLRVMQRFSRLRNAVGESPTRPQAGVRDVAPVTPFGPRKSKAVAAPPRRPSAPAKQRSARRSEKKLKSLAEGIVALGFLAVIFVMVQNGSWLPIITGLISALAPQP